MKTTLSLACLVLLGAATSPVIDQKAGSHQDIAVTPLPTATHPEESNKASIEKPLIPAASDIMKKVGQENKEAIQKVGAVDEIKAKVGQIKDETKAKVGEIKEDLKTKVGDLKADETKAKGG